MKKGVKTVLFLLFSLLFLTVYASASDTKDTGRMRIENWLCQDGAFSFDVRLPGAGSEEQVAAALYAESGRFKSSQFSAAGETVKMKLEEVSETDYVKVVWMGNQCQPLAEEHLRMPGNGTKANEQFEKDLRAAMRDTGGITEGASGAAGPYALARLIVCCDTLPSLDAYCVSAVIEGPDGLCVLQFASPDEAENCAAYLRTCPGVEYAEPDAIIHSDGTGSASAAASVPLSWGAEDTGVRAYAENLAQRKINNPVTVAVIDSGVCADHPLLSGRTVSGCDFVEGDTEAQDQFGHGTHVAGTVADCTAGMDIRIMPVRVLDAGGYGKQFDVSRGIRYAADHGANVINLSLSCDEHAPYIDDAVKYAVSKNITVVTAAGNKNRDAVSCCPAHVPACITVSAVDRDWNRAEFSNYGDGVDLAAPGVDIKSGWLDGGYREESGTSMAAPHVSAAAALLLCERGVSQTPQQISGALRDAAIPLGNGNTPYGAGLLNLKPFIIRTQRAIRFHANGGTGTMGPQSAANGETVTLKGNAFTREGFDFDGWNTAEDGSGVFYKDGAAVTVNDDLLLYAQWRKKASIFALLYEDGRLVFQTKEEPVSGGTPRKTWQVSGSGGAGAEYAKWFSDRSAIKQVIFAEPVEPETTALWFYGCGNLTGVSGVENLRAGRTRDMSQMFALCDSLTELDLTELETGNVENMSQMFFGCDKLKTIYASDRFDTSSVTSSRDMFTGCMALTGGQGTGYDEEHTDRTYARIDGASSAPGYFTSDTPYEVSWKDSEGCSISVRRESSPKGGAAKGPLFSGDTVYRGDVLQIIYSAKTGYTLTGHGEESITVTGNVTGDTIWASAKEENCTVTWTVEEGCSITVLLVPPPGSGASEKTLSSGDTVSRGDILKITYSAKTGYTLTGHGEETVTVTGNVTGDTIWATAKVNSYTVKWTTSTGCSISVRRILSPNAGASTGALSSGDTVYRGDVLQITYSAKTGYTLTGHGEETVTVTGNVTGDTIWAGAEAKKYTYTMLYCSSNGTSLGSTSYTLPFGQSQSVTPPDYAGYVTPSSRTVVWDTAENRDIVFTYSVNSVGSTTKTGRTCDEPLITFSAEVQHQNRTADSVQIRVVWTDTIQAYGYDMYSQNLNISANGVSAGTVTVAGFNLWGDSVNYERSSTGDTGWITVSAGARDTSVSVSAYHYQANYYGTNMDAYGVTPFSETWTIPIPAC